MSGGKRNFLPNVTDNVPNSMGVLRISEGNDKIFV